jgi:hypothetical protein
MVNLLDRAVLQEEMISRLPVAPGVIPLCTGHIPTVTMPGVVAAPLDGIALHTSGSGTARPSPYRAAVAKVGVLRAVAVGDRSAAARGPDFVDALQRSPSGTRAGLFGGSSGTLYGGGVATEI